MTVKTYRIGEAAAKLNLKTYVLRFWEMEFPQIAPLRTEKGQRLYTESDLAVLGRIRYLLHERGLTIEGARRLLREEAEKGVVYTVPGAAPAGPSDDLADDLAEEGADDLPDDTLDDDADETSMDRGPVQGSLLPEQPRRVPAPERGVDVAAVVTELQAIRRLLTF